MCRCVLYTQDMLERAHAGLTDLPVTSREAMLNVPMHGVSSTSKWVQRRKLYIAMRLRLLEDAINILRWKQANPGRECPIVPADEPAEEETASQQQQATPGFGTQAFGTPGHGVGGPSAQAMPEGQIAGTPGVGDTPPPAGPGAAEHGAAEHGVEGTGVEGTGAAERGVEGTGAAEHGAAEGTEEEEEEPLVGRVHICHTAYRTYAYSVHML